MKKIFFSVLILNCFNAFSQSPVDQIISSEKSFAETSRTQNTKTAFLAFVDEQCIGFDKGAELNVHDEWMHRRADSSKLTWQPQLAIAASSGELGVTTGPWQYYQKEITDTPQFHGQFASVWMKKTDGNWKVMLDIGASFNEKQKAFSSVKKITIAKQQYRLTYESELENVNINFNKAFAEKASDALDKYMDDDCFVIVDGHAPLNGSKQIKNNSEIIPQNISFNQTDFFVSKVQDLLAVYGRVEGGKTKQNYLCVWKRKGDNWKLMMLVIS